jgi:hypothetical protein
MRFEVTHKNISGETALYIMCVVFPSSLLGGLIGLEGFVGNLFRSKLGLAQDVVRDINNQHMVMFPTRIAWIEQTRSMKDSQRMKV